MTSPDKQESRGIPEQGEVRKDALVLFRGVIASPFNLEGIKPTVDVFERALEQSRGRNVIYMESSTQTREDVERSKVVIEHHGLVDPLLGNIFRAHRKTPTQDDLDRFRHTIDRAGTRSIEMGLVPPEMAREYFLHKELQRIRDTHPFDIEYESHPPKTISEISDLLEEVAHLSATNIEMWTTGQIIKLIENQKRCQRATRQIAILRIPDVVSDLTKITEDLLQTEEKGVLFIPFTAANQPLVDALRRNFWENAPLELQITSSGLEESPEMLIQKGLQNGTPAPDEVYAQLFLDTIMAATVQMHVMTRGRFTAYMENYETIARAISAIASSSSVEEIEDIARNKKGILDILRVHPSSTPLLPYISRLLI